jgi:hypothetical protein
MRGVGTYYVARTGIGQGENHRFVSFDIRIINDHQGEGACLVAPGNGGRSRGKCIIIPAGCSATGCGLIHSNIGGGPVIQADLQVNRTCIFPAIGAAQAEFDGRFDNPDRKVLVTGKVYPAGRIQSRGSIIG